jgi:hypothetical protein
VATNDPATAHFTAIKTWETQVSHTNYASTPQYAFMVWCLVKHRDNFTFTFTFSVFGVTRGHIREYFTMDFL